MPDIIASAGPEAPDADDAFLGIVSSSREEFASADMNWRAKTPPER